MVQVKSYRRWAPGVVATCRPNSVSAFTVAGGRVAADFWSRAGDDDGRGSGTAIAGVVVRLRSARRAHVPSRRRGPSSAGWPTFDGPVGEFSPSTRVSGHLLFPRPTPPIQPPTKHLSTSWLQQLIFIIFLITHKNNNNVSVSLCFSAAYLCLSSRQWSQRIKDE